MIPNNCYCVPQIITIMENLFSLSWFCFVYSECEFVSSWCLHLKEIDFIHHKHWFKLTKSYITTIAYDITKSLYGLWIWFFIFFSLLLFNDSIRLYSFNDFHIELLQQWTRVSRFYSNEIERNREKKENETEIQIQSDCSMMSSSTSMICDDWESYPAELLVNFPILWSKNSMPKWKENERRRQTERLVKFEWDFKRRHCLI